MTTLRKLPTIAPRAKAANGRSHGIGWIVTSRAAGFAAAATVRAAADDLAAAAERGPTSRGAAVEWRRRVGIEPTFRRFRAETTVLKTAGATRPHSPPSGERRQRTPVAHSEFFIHTPRLSGVRLLRRDSLRARCHRRQFPQRRH